MPHSPAPLTPESALQAYDSQLRTDAETPSAVSVEQLGPLRLVTFPGGRGFITYRDLGGAGEEEIRQLVAAATSALLADPGITGIEWKTRGHDVAPGLDRALLAAGYTPEETESIMVGSAEALAVDLPAPAGIALRRTQDPADVLRMCQSAGEAFGDSPEEARGYADSLLRRMEREAGSPDAMEIWMAEAKSSAGPIVVSGGRVEPVPGTDFAGIWGGFTLESWRGRGIYRALTAERARSALSCGKTLIQSDSTEFSRPILERYGFLKISTTTPYSLQRAPGGGV